MSIWPEILRRTIVPALFLMLSASALMAQPAELPEGLAPQLTEVYRILPVDGGIALDPKTSRNGIQRIEIKGQQVRVNGAQVPETVLGAWLQQDAEPILELLAMAPAQRRALFDLPPDPTAPSEIPSESLPVAPEEAEATTLEVESTLESTQDGVVENPVEVPEAPAAPTPPEVERSSAAVHSEGRVVIGRSFTVESDEIAEDVVVIGNTLRIEGEVLGDALAVGGTVWVDGRVSGDVASIGGGVKLKEGARIHGDVVSVGGGVERERGAQVFGEITEVALGANIFDFSRWEDFGRWENKNWGFQPRVPSPFRGFWRTTGGLAKILCLAFFACLVFLILQPQVRRAERIAATEPWKAGLVGLAAIIGFFAFFLPLLAIVCLVLTVTIIGIPLVFLLVFGVVVAAIALPLMGYSTAALRVGGILKQRFPGRLGQGVILVLVGVFAIEIWSFLAHVLGGAGWILALPVFLFALFGWLVRFSAWTVGLGAVLLSFASKNRTALGPGQPLPPLPVLPGGDDPVRPSSEDASSEDLAALHQDLGDLQDELEEELSKGPNGRREDDIVPPSPS